MKKRYADFLESHRKILLCCKDITADMASFYLVLSSLEDNGKPDQRKFLNEKMATISQTITRLADELTQQKSQ